MTVITIATDPYADFLAGKRITAPVAGLEAAPAEVNPLLFDFQKQLTVWALRKGRAALFADCGLGKTFMQLEWARLLGVPCLIVAPLSVARQTVAEARKLGVELRYARSGAEVAGLLTITNYEHVEKFDPAAFGAVVLDESSILKGLDGKTRAKLTEMFATTPYRLCCTATPAPNDISEIANHAEFLGIMSRADMLATFFVHDDDGWRLKRHAQEAFYRWLASWGMSVRRPSDLGFSDDGYILPPLEIAPVWVASDYTPEGMLFSVKLKGVQDRAKVRKATTADRVARAADLVNADRDQWIVWVGLNEEGRQLHAAIPGSVLVEGSQSPEEKGTAIEGFQDGRHRVMVIKPSIGGHGLNLQGAHKMVFVGLSDSWEAYYQCVRRCWRFGQTEPVNAYIVLSDAEQDIYANVMRKEREALTMQDRLIGNLAEFEKAEIAAAHDEWDYRTETIERPDYRIMLGDSSERLAEVADDSIDLSIFSPPFLSLYTYSPTERDIGNSRTEDEFFRHFGFVIDHLLRVTRPGRNCCVHVSQVPAMLSRDGYIGLKDFRSATIAGFERHGWIYHGEVCIDKDPQAQAIRTKSKGLLFVQMRKDATWLRPALADYILVFRKPGENAIPVQPDLTNEEWIEWARPIWYGIRETDTLQYQSARGAEDERHICPLQLGTIERCVRLWSNPGETVLSPFMGIGSEGYQSLKLGRRFLGVELKPEYFQVAARNLERAVAQTNTPTLFDLAEAR